jgi:hypothetical protein
MFGGVRQKAFHKSSVGYRVSTQQRARRAQRQRRYSESTGEESLDAANYESMHDHGNGSNPTPEMVHWTELKVRQYESAGFENYARSLGPPQFELPRHPPSILR